MATITRKTQPGLTTQTGFQPRPGSQPQPNASFTHDHNHQKSTKPILDWFQKKLSNHKKEKGAVGGGGTSRYATNGSSGGRGSGSAGGASESGSRKGIITNGISPTSNGTGTINNNLGSRNISQPSHRTGPPTSGEGSSTNPPTLTKRTSASPMNGWSTTSPQPILNTTQSSIGGYRSHVNSKKPNNPRPIISINRVSGGGGSGAVPSASHWTPGAPNRSNGGTGKSTWGNSSGIKIRPGIGIALGGRSGSMKGGSGGGGGGGGQQIRRSTSRHSSQSRRRGIGGGGSGQRGLGTGGGLGGGPGGGGGGANSPMSIGGRRAGSVKSKAPSTGSTSERRRRAGAGQGHTNPHHQPFTYTHSGPTLPRTTTFRPSSFRAPTFATRSSASPVSSRANSVSGSMGGYRSRSRSPSERSLASSFLDPDEEDGRSWLPSVLSRDVVGQTGENVDPDEDGNDDEGGDEDASLRAIAPSHGGSPVPSQSHFPILTSSTGIGGISSSRSSEPLRFSASFFPPQQASSALRPSSSHPRLGPISTSINNSRPASILSTTSSSARYGPHGYASSDAQSKGWKSMSGRSGGADSNGGVSTKPTTVASGNMPGYGWGPGLTDGMLGHIAVAPDTEGGTINEDETLDGSEHGADQGHGVDAFQLPEPIQGYHMPVAGPGPLTQAAQSQLAASALPVSPAAYRALARNSIGSLHGLPSPLSTSFVTSSDLAEDADIEEPRTPLPGAWAPALAEPISTPSSTENLVSHSSPSRYPLAQAPHRSDPHPRFNPKPHAAPSDTASLRTLASSEYAVGGHTMWTRSIAGTLDGAWDPEEEERRSGSHHTHYPQSRISLGQPINAEEEPATPTPVPIAKSGPIDVPNNKSGEEGDVASFSFKHGVNGPASLLGGVTASSYYFGGARRSIVGEDASIRALRRRGSWESDASRFSWVPGMVTTGPTSPHPKGRSEAQAAQDDANGVTVKPDTQIPELNVTEHGETENAPGLKGSVAHPVGAVEGYSLGAG